MIGLARLAQGRFLGSFLVEFNLVRDSIHLYRGFIVHYVSDGDREFHTVDFIFVFFHFGLMLESAGS